MEMLVITRIHARVPIIPGNMKMHNYVSTTYIIIYVACHQYVYYISRQNMRMEGAQTFQNIFFIHQELQ